MPKALVVKLETVPADTPAGVLVQLFTNVSHAMNVNIALLEQAFKNGVFRSPGDPMLGGGGKKKKNLKRRQNLAASSEDRPKRSPSGYLMYANYIRPVVKAEEPGLKPKEVMRELALRWQRLGAAEKQVWVQKAAEGKAAAAAAAEAKAREQAEAEALGSTAAQAAPPPAAAAASRKRKAAEEPEVIDAPDLDVAKVPKKKKKKSSGDASADADLAAKKQRKKEKKAAKAAKMKSSLQAAAA